MLTKEHKIFLAQMIFNEREILFGDCGPNLSKAEKQEKWIEIFIKLNSMGANIPDYKSLRDVEWSNIRRATEKKLSTMKENEMKPFEERINTRPLTALDEIVLDILGKGSGMTQRNEMDIPAGSQGYLDPAQLARIKYEDDDDDDFIDDTEDFGDDSYRPGMVTRKRKKRINKSSVSLPSAGPSLASGDPELNDLIRKKLRLECAKLELEVERLPLECAKIELQIQELQRHLMSSQNNL